MSGTIQVTPNLAIPALEDWEDRAACKGADPAIFYPEKGGGAARASARAKAICWSCPVRAECLDFALRHSGAYDDTFGSWGIWGGTGERDRRSLARPRRSGRAAA